MTAPWRKVVRDFWQERTRTVLVVVAIALGISGFFAVLSSYAILTRELDRGYLATNPASATLRTDAIDDVLLGAIRANRRVSFAEARRVVTGRIKAGPVEWRNLVLHVVKDYGDIRVSRLSPEQGAWPPATGEILIERDAFQVARARIGDTVIIKTAQGKEGALRVSGSVHDVGQAQARMENIVYGYITLGTLTQLGEEPYLDQLKIIVTENRFNEEHIRGVVADITKVIESKGHAVRRVDVPRPGKHPHTDIMGLLLQAMASFGLFILMLSGILVVTLLTAIMAAQIRQIGMMKAVGGSQWQIAQIYFGQAMLQGAAALLVGLPLGMYGNRLLCRYMAVFLNFNVNSFAVPLWVYLLVIAVGFVVPILSAAYPIWKWSGISIREALADFGVSRNAFGTSRFDHLLAGVGGTMRPLLLSVRNSIRRRTRLGLTVLTLAVGGLFFMSALNIRASMIRTLDRLFESMKFHLSLNLGTMVPFEKVERAARNTQGVVTAEGWIVTEATLEDSQEAKTGARAATSHTIGSAGALHEGGEQRDRFTIIALPADTSLLKPNIMEGRALQVGDLNTIVVNSSLAARHPLMKIGSEITLRMDPAQVAWRVIGISREPFSPPLGYVPRSYFEQFGGHAGMTNSIRLALENSDPVSISRVRESLDRNLEQEQIRALGSSTQADRRIGFDQHMVMIYVFLIIVSGILGGVGGLGLMTTMSLNVLERRREMGVLRAIGAAPSVVWRIIVAEGCVIGVASWALSALVAWPVSKFLGDGMVTAMFQSRLDFVFELRGLFIWLAITVLLGVVASFLPAWHASRMSVREAIEYE